MVDDEDATDDDDDNHVDDDDDDDDNDGLPLHSLVTNCSLSAAALCVLVDEDDTIGIGGYIDEDNDDDDNDDDDDDDDRLPQFLMTYLS